MNECMEEYIYHRTSMIGLEARTFFSTAVSLTDPPTFAKYRIANFALTVLPAPDSPETIIDWFSSCLKNRKVCF